MLDEDFFTYNYRFTFSFSAYLEISKSRHGFWCLFTMCSEYIRYILFEFDFECQKSIEFFAGVIVFIRLFWLIGIAGALQTLLIVFICSSCVCYFFSFFSKDFPN